jgi:succinylarginine dihydrolase
MPATEINFDGIPGPTHNYAGLSIGNLASQAHTNSPSHPKQAALQGLAKMEFLADLGIPQAVLPPHERPDIFALRRLGFTGSDAKILESASQHPTLLASCGSASAMWAANAATISPSPDTADHRVHITPANLQTQFHRSLEAPTTAAILRAIFQDNSIFAHHDPLPGSPQFGDEGAANHTRLCRSYEDPALEIFVYGRQAMGNQPNPTRFPARQTLEASQSIARLHALNPENTLFLQQNPKAIEAGAFHNDVVAVGNLNVLFYHASAFADQTAPEQIRRALQKSAASFYLIEAREEQIPLSDAVSSYLFNSQLVQLPDQTMALIAPTESHENPRTRAFLDHLLQQNTPIKKIHYVDVRQSMNNGGGPACLRLRVVLTDRERNAVNPSVFLTHVLYASLKGWIERHYRENLTPADLADPNLLEESRQALDELTQLLNLGSIYPFQIAGRAPKPRH